MPEIHHQFTIKASIREVFKALSTSQGLNNWWTLESAGLAAMGGQYRFYFGPQYDWKAQVIHFEEGKGLTWKMTKATEDWVLTELGFILTKKDEGTSVHFFHRNWKEANDHFAITNFIWGQLLYGMKNYVEKGIIVPFDNRN
jgi:uncharacterized protein YndB with AHSA1/START domain